MNRANKSQPRTQMKSIDKKKINKNNNNVTDDNLSSVSNSSNELLSLLQDNSNSLIDLKSKNLNANSSYFVSLKIKVKNMKFSLKIIFENLKGILFIY